MFLVDAIVCVYVSIQLYCSCCHYGVIKHDDYCRKSAVTALVHLTESKTAENLSKVFLRVLQQWRIPLMKVNLVLRDNGPNIAKATRVSAVASIGCLAHTLQLVIKDVLLVRSLYRTCCLLHDPSSAISSIHPPRRNACKICSGL